MLLDTASNGSFLNKDVDDGWELIENLAQADGQYGDDYDRNMRSTSNSDSVSRKEIKALNEKLDRLFLVHQKQVNVMCEDELVQKGEKDQLVEISFVQNQGRGYNGYNNYKQHPNISYRSTNIANPQDQDYLPQPPNAQPTAYVPQQPEPQQPEVLNLLQQLLQGQTATTTEISKKIAEVHTKIDASHNDLNCKFETLNARLKYLESQQAASSTVKTSGQLPGNATPNPTVHTTKSITLRNGKELAPCAGNIISTEDSVVQEGEDDQIKKKVAKSIPNAELDIPTRTAGVRVESPSVQNLEPLKDLRKSSVLPPLKPQIPFLGRLKKDLAVKYRNLFDKQMKEVELKIPILDAFALIPQYQKFLKEAVKEKSKEVDGLAFETFECRALAQGRIVQEKLEDPGTFTLPCSLGHLTFKKSLCDLGASISLMPLTVAKRLGFYDYKSCKLSLVLADSTTRSPHGLLENLPIRIGNMEVPTDFVVLDMDEEPQDPLLLGRPFLASAGALIDVRSGTIELNCGRDLKMKFDINETKKRPTIEGQSFSIEGLDQLDINPLKPPQVVLVKSGKASDYCR